MKRIVTLLQKDFQQEKNSGEILVVSLTLCILLGTLTAFGIRQAILPIEALDSVFPTLIWLLFFFTGMLVVVRLSDADYRDAAYKSVLLSGASPSAFFLSKVFLGSALLLPLHLLNFLLLYLLLQPTFSVHFWWLLALSTVVVICFVSLSVLLSAIAETSQLKNVLFPILLLPVMFPVFLGALSLTQELYLRDTIALSHFWAQALPALMFLYLGLGASLFEHVLLE